MTFPGICSSLIQSKRERYFVSYTISIWAYFRIGINLAVNRVNFLHRNWERSSYQGHPVFFLFVWGTFDKFQIVFNFTNQESVRYCGKKNIQLFLSLPRKGKNVIARLLNSIKTPSIRKGFGFLAFYIQTPMLTLFLCKVDKGNGQH